MTAASGRVLALAALAASSGAPLDAWLTGGHRRVTAEAVALLPAEVPAFFSHGAATIAHASVDPDLWRNRDTPALGDRTAPEHYFDLELLGGAALPERRRDLENLLGRLGVAPHRIGALPYAIVERAEQLALAFAEHRRWPTDEAIRAKCLLQAGWLAHFAGDLAQPLHTTIHHDGRAKPDGEPPFTGIHRQVDALFDVVPAGESAQLAVLGPLPIGDLPSAIAETLTASHALVDPVYEIESRLPVRGSRIDRRVEAFATERYRTTVRFVAGVLLWSWRRSAEIDLPEWLAR